MVDESKGSPIPLVAAVAAAASAPRDEQPADESGPGLVAKQDAALLTSQTLSLIASVNETLATKSTPEEADGYKRWVFEVARKTAESAKEGGFLGIGGTPVTREEHATLTSLAAALGVPGVPSVPGPKDPG